MAKYCNFQISLLKIIGIWPSDGKCLLVHLLQKFVLYVQMATLLLISVALTLGAFFSDDLKNVSSSVDMVTLTLSATYKLWFISSHIRRFQQLIHFVDHKFRAAISNRSGRISVRERSKNCSLYTALLCSSGAFVMLLYSIVPVLENEAHIKSCNSTEQLFRQIRFPVLTWIPFDVYWSPVYEILYATHSFALFAAANVYLVSDSFFFMMIYQIYLQMKMLKEMLENVGNGGMDYMDGHSEMESTAAEKLEIERLSKKNPKYEADHESKLIPSITEMSRADEMRVEIEIQMKLKECISFHSNVLKVIITIEELFRSMILADVLHGIISLSFALHETGVADSIFNKIKLYGFLMVCIVHQLGNSYYGQMLLNSQEMIAEAVYNLQWYNANMQTKKYLVLIIARSNKLTTLNGGKMYYLRFESFVMFMKTLFSYYMVLRQASSESK